MVTYLLRTLVVAQLPVREAGMRPELRKRSPAASSHRVGAVGALRCGVVPVTYCDSMAETTWENAWRPSLPSNGNNDRGFSVG